MKNIFIACLLSIIFSGLFLSILAGNGKENHQIKESTIQSLLEGLNSDNIGLKSSCAYMLGKLKIAEAVIPLMRVLHNDENEQVRISAVLALYMIATPIAIYAVRQAIRFDESNRVNKLAQNFYNDILQSRKTNSNKTNKNLIAHHL